MKLMTLCEECGTPFGPYRTRDYGPGVLCDYCALENVYVEAIFPVCTMENPSQEPVDELRMDLANLLGMIPEDGFRPSERDWDWIHERGVFLLLQPHDIKRLQEQLRSGIYMPKDQTDLLDVYLTLLTRETYSPRQKGTAVGRSA